MCVCLYVTSLSLMPIKAVLQFLFFSQFFFKFFLNLFYFGIIVTRIASYACTGLSQISPECLFVYVLCNIIESNIILKSTNV